MKFNRRYFKIAAWITLILTYIMPYQSTEGVSTGFGYPFPFLTIYDKPASKILLTSAHTNLGTLFIDILIIYFIICLGKLVWDRCKPTAKKANY